MNDKPGILYIVGTPIGNLSDISQRALRILKKADLIAAEDTRHTKKLLNHFEIKNTLESYHKFSEKNKSPKLINHLKEGKNIALVSNAGMPGISDPGELLVREAIRNDIQVVPIPGPSAAILALAASGLATDRFIFEGFLPRKKSQQEKILYSLRNETRTVIFYESGQRLKNTIITLNKILGNRPCVIARELTKKFEEIIRGNFDNILDKINNLKGEFVIIIGGQTEEKKLELPLKEEIERLQKELDISPKEAIKLTSAAYNIPRRKVYETWHSGKRD